MDNFKESIEKLCDEVYEETGIELDVEKSVNNLTVAFVCEAQRLQSAMPEIPVISEIEITNRDVFNIKLDSFGSDFFFFLKEQEGSFDQNPYPSSFYGEYDKIEEMIRNAISEEAEGTILHEWINTSEPGDKIRLRKYLTNDVTGEVAITEDGVTAIEQTDEYIILLVRTEQLFDVIDAYPV